MGHFGTPRTEGHLNQKGHFAKHKLFLHHLLHALAPFTVGDVVADGGRQVALVVFQGIVHRASLVVLGDIESSSIINHKTEISSMLNPVISDISSGFIPLFNILRAACTKLL